ncbi:MAG: hypothetical protein KatS3mg010_1119 [Acidimicrobiia bacterium]|nr:MAG: hypothetical protein KatS3mg010_1119 [Acidimicrobiia bacterium]
MSDHLSPIFIGGLSHSGKTQLRIALGAHPDLCLTRRTYLWTRYFGRFGDLAVDANLERCLDALVADPQVARLAPDRDALRAELLDGPRRYARLFGLVHRHHAERLGKRRWGEQLGSVERFAAAIFEEYPDARMVHMIRDPRTRFDETGAAHRRGKVGWETALWVSSAELAERNEARFAPNYQVIRYETLAARPVETVSEVCSFIGEEPLPPVLESAARLRFDPDPPPARSFVERRRRFASSFASTYARAHLTALRYEADGPRLGAGEQMAFLFVDRPLNVTTMAAWRMTRGRRFLKQSRSR